MTTSPPVIIETVPIAGIDWHIEMIEHRGAYGFKEFVVRNQYESSFGVDFSSHQDARNALGLAQRIANGAVQAEKERGKSR